MSKHGTRRGQEGKALGDLPQGVTFDKSSPRPGIPSSRIFCGSRCVTNVSGTDAPWDFPGPPPRLAELVRVARGGAGPSGWEPPCPELEPQRLLVTAVGGAGLGEGGAQPPAAPPLRSRRGGGWAGACVQEL